MPGKHSRNEVSYYPEIQTFIEAQLKSNFKAKRHKELSVFWGIGELKTNLQRIIAEHPEINSLINEWQEKTKAEASKPITIKTKDDSVKNLNQDSGINNRDSSSIER